MCGLLLNQPALQSELRCRESPVHVQGFFHRLSPGNNFAIGFGVAHSAGRVNWGTTETGFTKRDVLFESRIPKSKENPLRWYKPLIIPGWDNRK